MLAYRAGFDVWLLLFLFAAIVILIRLYAFYFGPPHSRHYGISLTYMAHAGVAVEKELFLATFVVRMAFRNAVSTQLPGVWNGNVSTYSADVAVPRLCGFPQARGGLPAAMYAALLGYTSASPLCACMCLWTRLHGGSTLAGRAGIPYSYGFFITLYRDIRGMCLLPVSSCYDTYNTLRRS